MSTWIAVIAAGVATYAIRLSFIALFGRIEVPDPLERALRYVPPAVLAAIAVPGVAAPGGLYDLWNPFVPAAILGGLAAWKTRSIGAAILIGMPSLWIVLWLAERVS